MRQYDVYQVVTPKLHDDEPMRPDLEAMLVHAAEDNAREHGAVPVEANAVVAWAHHSAMTICGIYHPEMWLARITIQVEE